MKYKNLVRHIAVSTLTAGSLLMGGCATGLPAAGPGVILTETIEGVSANNGVPGDRKGEACAKNILGIVASGDSTIAEAKRNAGITRVATVDRSFFSVLGVYAKVCTVVTGK